MICSSSSERSKRFDLHERILLWPGNPTLMSNSSPSRMHAKLRNSTRKVRWQYIGRLADSTTPRHTFHPWLCAENHFIGKRERRLDGSGRWRVLLRDRSHTQDSQVHSRYHFEVGRKAVRFQMSMHATNCYPVVHFANTHNPSAVAMRVKFGVPSPVTGSHPAVALNPSPRQFGSEVGQHQLLFPETMSVSVSAPTL